MIDYDLFQEMIEENASLSSPTPSTTDSKEDSNSRLNHSSPYHALSQRSTSPETIEAPRNVVHIVTKDFPQYFAVVSRPRQDIAAIGPEGALLVSSNHQKAQVYHKPK